eukprot:GEMP01010244.1.p1 GENE.GEMP01010244.1~~GEMP01010244.1.p1  ORF type:complete len:461 (+),score=75.76 GEMP01010244.1:82-1464(+)
MTTLRRMDNVEISQYNCDIFSGESKQIPADHVISGYLTFANLPDTAKLRQALLHTVKSFGRLHSVADSTGNWTPQEHLDGEYHVVEEQVDDINLRKNTLLREKFDLNKPLWRCHILVTPNRDDHCAVVRIHHCVGDGLRLAKFLEALCQTENGQPSNVVAESRKKFAANPPRGFLHRLLRTLDIVPSFIKVLITSVQGYESEFAGHTSLKHRKAKMPFQEHRVADLPILSLSEVKAVKNALNGTINDVLFTWMAGAYRRYGLAKGDPQFAGMASKLTARSLVPVAFPVDDKWETGIDVLCNRFCFVSVDIPLKYPSVDDRFMAVRKAFDYLKGTTFALVSLFMAEFVASLSAKLRHGVATDVFSTHTNVFSNIPGPADALYLCGEKIESISGAYSNLITQFMVISYNDKLFGTVVLDPNVLEPELIVKMFAEEWEYMKNHALRDTSVHTSEITNDHAKRM